MIIYGIYSTDGYDFSTYVYFDSLEKANNYITKEYNESMNGYLKDLEEYPNYEYTKPILTEENGKLQADVGFQTLGIREIEVL